MKWVFVGGDSYAPTIKKPSTVTFFAGDKNLVDNKSQKTPDKGKPILKQKPPPFRVNLPEKNVVKKTLHLPDLEFSKIEIMKINNMNIKNQNWAK